jgi:hypothetical protein
MSEIVCPELAMNFWNSASLGNCFFDFVELRLDFRVGDFDPLVFGLAEDPPRRDQEAQDLLLEGFEFLCALGLQRRRRGLGDALRRLRLGRFQVRDAGRVVGRIGNHRLRARRPRARGGCNGDPVVEGRRADRRAVDLHDRVAGDPPAAGHEADDYKESGAQRRD